MRKLLKRIERLFYFLPIIWKGYDWDYRYAVELFQHQLKRTSNFLDSDKAYSADAKNSARRIRTAIDLLEKVYDEDYGFEYSKKIEEKYGKSKFEFVERGVDNMGETFYEMIEVFEKDYTKEELLLIEEEKNTLMWESRAKQKKAHNLVWKYISHNIQRWWD